MKKVLIVLSILLGVYAILLAAHFQLPIDLEFGLALNKTGRIAIAGEAGVLALLSLLQSSECKQ